MYVLSHSVMSDSLQPHGLQPTRLLCPWKFPDKNTGVGCCFLLQGIFPTQGLNPCLLHLLNPQADFFFFFLPLSHLGSCSDGDKGIEIALCCFRTNEDSQLLAPTSEVSLPSVICPVHLRMGQVVTAADSVCWWGS